MAAGAGSLDEGRPLIFVEVAFETLLTFVEIVESDLKEFLTFCTDWFSDTFILGGVEPLADLELAVRLLHLLLKRVEKALRLCAHLVLGVQTPQASSRPCTFAFTFLS